jgi:signal transduction histidine kinase/DNA-binding response OmpR family regulator/HAMP domain-containing protein
MSFIRKLSLTGKLMLIALLPLVFLVYLAIQLSQEKMHKIEILKDYNNNISRSVAISSVVDDLQAERRFSFGNMVKRQWQTELAVSRQKTDEDLKKLRDTTDESLKRFASFTMLNRLLSIRQRIDSNLITPEEVMDYYSNSIFRLNTLNNVFGGTTVYLEKTSKELVAQKLLSEMASYLGLLRSNLYYDLYRNQTPSQITSHIHNLYDIYNSYQAEFLFKASPEAIERYNSIRQGGDLKQTIEYLDNLINNRKVDAAYTADSWWTVSANGMDEVRGLQKSLLRQVRQSVDDIYRQENTKKNYTVILLVVSLVLLGFILLEIIRIITKMLNDLRMAAQEIAAGKIGVKINIESNDSIGQLAASIQAIDESYKELANAAYEIGKGNFNLTITPRSSEDVLSNSIKAMKQELRRFSQEDKNKIWIHTGIEAVNDEIAGEKSVKVLAEDVLKALVEYLECEVGLFYCLKEDRLEFVAGYAIPDLKSVPLEIRLGETLVGQAAIKKETIHLKDVPDNYLTIASGIGKAQPKNILIVPLVHEGTLEGVLEIGSFSELKEVGLSMVEQVKSNITLALEAAKKREWLQELLEETQSQAEELQTQHSELESLNTELEAQTMKLQASEEELKVQQEELLQANQELEERSKLLEERNQIIVDRNLEIQHKAEQLELSTKYKSEFLANMSHELRTPLNSILLLSRLLAENNAKNLSKEQIEYAEVIQSSGSGLLSLIDEILDLSKIEAGKMDFEITKVSVESISRDLKALFAPVAKEKNIEFNITIDQNAPSTIETDKLRLEQVLKNLISNALKFTPRGSVALNISAVEGEEAFITFSVEDTGIGIAKDKQDLIFEAFSQEDGSTRRRFGGTGLGLSISKELTRLLGGEIKLKSESGKGSVFTIYLPVSKDAVTTAMPAEITKDILSKKPVAEEAVGEVQKAATSKYTASFIPRKLGDDRSGISAEDKTILIVEDDTNFAKILLDYTRNKGYKGIVAVSGDTGIEMAQQYKPTAILLDIQLPVKDGWEVMEELKNNPATRHIPVHIMSAHSVKKESLQKGAVDFINKPVALEQIQEVFKKIEHVITREGKKVLIVEENRKHAKALAYFLETFNVTSEIATDVHNGINALHRDDIDCVILDMGIPDSHAYETLEAIKKNPGLEKLPIIIFTGKNLSKAEEQKIKQYADSIVIKTAWSYQRILDEVSLFLHLLEENQQPEKSSAKHRKLGGLNEVLSHKKILIADDDVRNIFSLTKVLEQHDMKVLSAMDGKEALNQLEANHDIDIILMDIMMPEMDGYEATKRIRDDFKFRNLPIIAVTAKAMTGDRDKCIRAGASDYISKPVDIDQLLSLLRVWLYDK